MTKEAGNLVGETKTHTKLSDLLNSNGYFLAAYSGRGGRLRGPRVYVELSWHYAAIATEIFSKEEEASGVGVVRGKSMAFSLPR
jgi:hypothetical protein